MDVRGDLVERCRLHAPDGCEQRALLALSLGQGDVAAKLFDQLREAVGERRRCGSPNHPCSLANIRAAAMLLLLNWHAPGCVIDEPPR